MDTNVMNTEVNTEALDSVASDTADALDGVETDLEAAVDMADTAEIVGEPGGGFKFEPQNFVDNLSYMGLGMLGIFIVIGVIMGVTVVLNKIFKK